MKKITTRLLCASSILLFGLSSCVKDVDLSQAPEKPVKGDYFDFQTTLNCPIDIDLGLQDYTVSIEIYYAAIHNTDPKFGLYTVNQYSTRRPVHRQFIGFSPKTDDYIAAHFIDMILDRKSVV